MSISETVYHIFVLHPYMNLKQKNRRHAESSPEFTLMEICYYFVLSSPFTKQISQGNGHYFIVFSRTRFRVSALMLPTTLTKVHSGVYQAFPTK
jgi:hypothetical protein